MAPVLRDISEENKCVNKQVQSDIHAKGFVFKIQNTQIKILQFVYMKKLCKEKSRKAFLRT